MSYVKFVNSLWTYAGPIVTVLGIASHLLVLVVIVKNRLLRNTTTVYMFILSVVSIVFVLLVVSRVWGVAVFDIDWKKTSDEACQFFHFLSSLLIIFQPWVLINITVERFLMVYFPHRAQHWVTVRRAGVVLAVFFTVALVNAAAQSSFYRLVPGKTPGTSSCSPTGFLRENFIKWRVFGITAGIATPLVILTLGSAAIGRKIRKNRLQTVGDAENLTEAEKKRLKEMNAITLGLVGVCLLFVIARVPFCAVLVYATMTSQFAKLAQPSDDPLWMANAFTTLLFVISLGCNILCYSAGATRFRRQLISLFRCETNAVANEPT